MTLLLISAAILFVLALCSRAEANEMPRPEHPRPDFRREPWLNLNGTWQFEFDPKDEGESENWFKSNRTFSREITVPYPWQSPLSGINEPKYAGVAWYSRQVTIPSEWKGKRAILKFGAVDWNAKVWVNGKLAGEHTGGYTPFELDITDLVSFGKPAAIVLRAYDPGEMNGMLVGKQHRWFTPTGGIWQTVYLEARSAIHIARCQITPDTDNNRAEFALRVTCPEQACNLALQIDITAPSGRRITHSQPVTVQKGRNNFTVMVAVPMPELWSPDTPNLYHADLVLSRGEKELDRVQTCFGMRKIETRPLPGTDINYIYINNKPIYLRGVLTHGFHPDGVYTYPSEAVIEQDLRRAKELGFNFIRVHLKVDDPLLYHWADRLGLVVMYDLPNFPERGYGPEARENYERMLRDAIARDYNHPSIIIWCLFNETWGLQPRYKEDEEKQGFVEGMYQLAKSLDKTRLVNDMSACNEDHVTTDINDWHFCINNYMPAKTHLQSVVERTYPGSPWNHVPGTTQSDAPLLNTDFGGISIHSGNREVSWSFRFLINELRMHEKICGYVYTQLTDVENEYNGIMRYDRTMKEFGFDIAAINGPDAVLLDAVPGNPMEPGQRLSFDVFTSHFSDSEYDSLTLKWALDGTDVLGDPWQKDELGSRAITMERYHVHPAGRIEFTAPEGFRVGRIVVWIEDSDGRRITENHTNIMVHSPLPQRPDMKIISFKPGSFVAAEWNGPVEFSGTDLSANWRFKRGQAPRPPFAGIPSVAKTGFDDSAWEIVRIPHIWVDPIPGEHGWYRKVIELTKEDLDREAILSLGPIDDTSYIYLNGHYLGGLINDWTTPLNFAVREYLKEGENVIAVCVKTQVGGAGIYGHVDFAAGNARNIWVRGVGYFLYEIPVESLEGASEIRVRFEASGEEPGRQQTDEYRSPSDLTISMEGIELDTVTLPDSPCDSRGIVSRLMEFRDRKYGYLVDVAVPQEKLKQVISSAGEKGCLTLKLEVKPDAVNKNGLVLFGHDAGRFGIDPMILLK